MVTPRATNPQLLGLLRQARVSLEEEGLAAGSETLNTDVRAALQSRQQALLDRHGGAWLGSLWHWQPWRMAWHRH